VLSNNSAVPRSQLLNRSRKFRTIEDLDGTVQYELRARIYVFLYFSVWYPSHKTVRFIPRKVSKEKLNPCRDQDDIQLQLLVHAVDCNVRCSDAN
jgi:hypothetical protein